MKPLFWFSRQGGTGGGGGVSWDYIWDASALSLTNGDPITTLANTGAQAGGTLTAPGSGPLFAAAALNGLGVMSFNGATSSRYLITSGLLITGTDPFTILAVAKATDATGRVDPVCGQGNGTASGSWRSLQIRNAGGADGDPYFAGYTADVDGPTPPSGQWMCYALRWDGTTIKHWRSNTGTLGPRTNAGTPTLTTAAGDGFYVGAIDIGGAPDYFDGQIAEVRAQLSALSDAELEIEAIAIMAKYALN